jgi:S1-C subfamily serine protease
MGAGVAVAASHVLTAHYLVLGAATVEVVPIEGHTQPVGKVALDHESGLALLSVDGPPLRPARLAADHDVGPGRPVFLLTCTDSRERRGATGHVLSVGPFEAFWEYMLDQAIMTTALNPGLAGGPLHDLEGRVIGVVSLGLAAVGRYTLAIPIGLFHDRRARLEKGEPVPPRDRRAWIGFYPQGQDGGVTLTGVVPEGPAEKAGLERGDVILSVDGEVVSSLRELYLALWRRSPGDTVGMQVLREEAIRVVDVVAGDRYEFFK